MTQNGFLGTIGWIKSNLMVSSQASEKGYSNENFYPGAENIPESEPTRPDGVPPVTDGLVGCFDGNVDTFWSNLIKEDVLFTYAHSGGQTTGTDEYGTYREFNLSKEAGLKISTDGSWYYPPLDTTVGYTYIMIFKLIRDKYGDLNTNMAIMCENGNIGTTLKLFSGSSAPPFKMRGTMYNGYASINKYADIEISDPTESAHVYTARAKGTITDFTNRKYVKQGLFSCDNTHAATATFETTYGSNGIYYFFPSVFYYPSESNGNNKRLYATYIYNRPLTDDELNKVIKYGMERYNIKG